MSIMDAEWNKWREVCAALKEFGVDGGDRPANAEPTTKGEKLFRLLQQWGELKGVLALEIEDSMRREATSRATRKPR